MDIKLIDNVEFGGIVYEYKNDYSDIYVISADYDGLPMDGDQLDELNHDTQMVYELYIEYEDWSRRPTMGLIRRRLPAHCFTN